MRRREFITLLGGATAAWSPAVRAQQSGGSRLVGMLMAYKEDNPQARALFAAFRGALANLGWVEGRNVKFECRWATTPTLLQQGAKELVALQPSLILSSNSPTTASSLQETRTIPIVFVAVVDPVGQGFIANLARPGGNATGFVNLTPSMAGKWLELLQEVMPRASRVAIAFDPTTASYADYYLNFFKSSASSFGMEFIAESIPDMAAFETFVAAQSREPNTGFVQMPSAFTLGHASEIAAMMARYRLPAIYSTRAFIEAGGLLSYGNDNADNYRRAAAYAGRILRGEKPNGLPVQFPVKFELVINLKTAEALGLTVPPTLLALADEVIE